MKYALMLAVAGTVMTGCGAEDMETRDEATSESGIATQGVVKEKRHCVAQAVSVEHGQTLPANIAPPAVNCFDTLAEAVSYATKGAVKMGPQATAADLDDVSLAEYVTAYAYDLPNYRGSILILQSPITCAQGSFYWASLETAWDNVISSVRLVDTSCGALLHYPEPNLQGAWAWNCGYGYLCSSMGQADNLTSSIEARRY